jgi:hypothetical protein
MLCLILDCTTAVANVIVVIAIFGVASVNKYHQTSYKDN